MKKFSSYPNMSQVFVLLAACSLEIQITSWQYNWTHKRANISMQAKCFCMGLRYNLPSPNLLRRNMPFWVQSAVQILYSIVAARQKASFYDMAPHFINTFITSVARWQNLIPTLPRIAPGWRAGVEVRKPRKGRDQILQRSIAEPQSFKPKRRTAHNLEIWL